MSNSLDRIEPNLPPDPRAYPWWEDMKRPYSPEHLRALKIAVAERLSKCKSAHDRLMAGENVPFSETIPPMAYVMAAKLLLNLESATKPAP